jgi:MFS transporter, CP family, cyanate transporter
VQIRFAFVLGFSALGGLVPATLFALAVRLAPGESTVVTTVGWMHQCSAIGQFCGPPLLAWLVAFSGGWQISWVAIGATGLCAVALVSVLLPGMLRRPAAGM